MISVHVLDVLTNIKLTLSLTQAEQVCVCCHSNKYNTNVVIIAVTSHSLVKDGGDFYLVSFELWTDVRHSRLIGFF